jgi:hypothetical protein
MRLGCDEEEQSDYVCYIGRRGERERERERNETKPNQQPPEDDGRG